MNDLGYYVARNNSHATWVRTKGPELTLKDFARGNWHIFSRN